MKKCTRCVLLAALCACLLSGGTLGFSALAQEQPAEAPAQPEMIEAAVPWLARNPDTIGWLKVGKVIDMPIVQRDNSFYLSHDYSGAKASGGTIFLDENCSILPQDDQLILYGHNMRIGTVFGELDRFRDLSYLKANPIITFDTLYEEAKYVIIAVFDMSAETEDPHFMQMLHFNFVDNEDFMTYYFEARRRSFFDIPVDVQYGDKLLTMITCSYSLRDGRLITMLRKLRPDEDPQSVAEVMQATVKK